MNWNNLMSFKIQVSNVCQLLSIISSIDFSCNFLLYVKYFITSALLKPVELSELFGLLHIKWSSMYVGVLNELIQLDEE